MLRREKTRTMWHRDHIVPPCPMSRTATIPGYIEIQSITHPFICCHSRPIAHSIIDGSQLPELSLI